jgi:hypothetical protein
MSLLTMVVTFAKKFRVKKRFRGEKNFLNDFADFSPECARKTGLF